MAVAAFVKRVAMDAGITVLVDDFIDRQTHTIGARIKNNRL